jgi:hypothetical protein
MPQMPNAPRSAPPSGPSSGPNMSNQSGAGIEQQENTFAKSVAQSKVVKKMTSVIISSREDFVEYLKQSNLELLTSAIIFKETADFIDSSYIVYPNHNGRKEPLGQFLLRYPELQPMVMKINEDLKLNHQRLA